MPTPNPDHPTGPRAAPVPATLPPPGPGDTAAAAADSTVGTGPTLAPGSVLAGYRIERLLGRGGMGAVYLATDPTLGRQVAVKTMRADLAADPTARERFLREARATAQVEHEHVVAVYGVGEDAGTPFLVMPLLRGESLDDRLRRHPWPTLAEACRIGREVALGLAAAHETGLIHRDVKPANVWLDGPTGKAKLLDFGLARAARSADHLTRSGAVVGTPAYMAPEQARGLAVDHRCDLFSLGCVLYELTTGRRPFRGEDVYAVLTALATEAPPPVREVNPVVPPALGGLVAELLAKDPGGRPGSARAVADRLAAIEHDLGGGPATRPGDAPTIDLPAAAPAGRPARRRAAAVLAVAALALVPAGYHYGGAVVRYATNTGEVVIETDGPGVEVTITDGTATVYDKVKDRRFVLTPGEYELEVREDGPDGVRLGTKKFTLTRGGKEIVTARLEAVAKKPEAKPAPDAKATAADPDRKAAAWVLAQRFRSIRIRVGDAERAVLAARDLPSGPFQVIEIDLHGSFTVADGGLANLRGLPHLRSLTLSNTTAGDEELAHLRDLPSLTYLKLPLGGRVTGAGLAHLSGLRGLELLYLPLTRVTDAGLAHLVGLPRLKHLMLAGTQVTDRGLEHLRRLPALRTLYLDGTAVTDAGLEYLRACPGVVGVSLSGTRVTDAGLARLRDWPGFAGLGLDGSQLTDTGLGHLRRMPDLRSLTLPDVDDAGLARLKGLEKLESLELQMSRVTDAGLDHLRAFPNLRHLSLNGTGVTDAGLDHLRGAKGLAGLGLSNTRVTETGAGRLRAALPGCYVWWGPTGDTAADRRAAEWVLGLGGTATVCQVWGDGREVRSVGEMPGGGFLLYAAGLAGRVATDAGLEHLKQLGALRRLDLSGTGVGDAGLAHLRGHLTLDALDLSETKLTDAGLAHVRTLPNLAELSLTNTAVTDAGLAHLRGLSRLRELDLTGTGVTAAGGGELRKALPDCRVLTGPTDRR